MQSWVVPVAGRDRQVACEGWTETGRARLRVDGEEREVPPLYLKGRGFFYRTYVDGVELLLCTEKADGPVRLAVDGRYRDGDSPVDSDLLLAVRRPGGAEHPLKIRWGIGMPALLSFVALSYLSIFLFIVRAPFRIPFTAALPGLTLDVFYAAFTQQGAVALYIVGVVLALLLATVYLAVYLLARARDAAVWLALALVVLDMALVLQLSLTSATYYILNVAYHVWVAACLVQLLRVRAADKKRAAADTDSKE